MGQKTDRAGGVSSLRGIAAAAATFEGGSQALAGVL